MPEREVCDKILPVRLGEGDWLQSWIENMEKESNSHMPQQKYGIKWLVSLSCSATFTAIHIHTAVYLLQSNYHTEDAID